MKALLRIVPEDYIGILAFILNMPVFINVLNVMANQLGLSSSIITSLFYIGTLIYILVTCKISTRDFGLLFVIYLLFATNYILFPISRDYLVEQGMIILYVFFIPYCVFAIRKINDWSSFFERMRYYVAPAILSAGFMLVFLDYKTYLIYMGFSYALLPVICVSYYAWREDTTKPHGYRKTMYGICFIIGLIEIMAFGARATIIFALAYIVLFEVTRSDASSSKKILIAISLGAIIFLIFLFYNQILTALSQLPVFSGSYFIRRALEGELLESRERLFIQEACMDRLATMGWAVSGLFGDRPYLRGWQYPHNIFFEILMSFGWIIGVAIILSLAILLIRNYLKRGTRREITVFVVCAIISKFLVSGSYITEGKFWVGLFMLVCMTRNQLEAKRT